MNSCTTLPSSPCSAAPVLAPGMSAPLRPGDVAVVVGAGASGRAAVRLLKALGATVRLVDKNENPPEETRAFCREENVELRCGAHTPAQFDGADLVVTSPGVPLTLLAPLLAQVGNPPLMAEMELALRYVHEPVLAVTGTSGKTTTVSLAAAMLEAGGKKVFLGGNIGTPLSEYVLAPNTADVLVLEMSSFQLQGSTHLHPRVAVILNLSPNHLDHHKDMEEYREAKFRIFSLQNASDLALLPPSLADEYRSRGCRARLEVFTPGTRFAHTRLMGDHNAANAEAAWLACKEFGVAEADAIRAVAEFAPLRHRLEPVATVNGATYVNDSKCTTVDALAAALQSFSAPVLLLAGGKFKGGDLAGLHDLLRRHVKAVALFGAGREIFTQAWQGVVPLTWDAELPEAVRRLAELAAPGEVVLLSPATASYDLYVNYKARGDHFRSLAQALAAGTAAKGGA